MTEEAYIKIFHKYVEKGLTPSALVVYSLIANYCDNFGECSLSIQDIKMRCNVKDPRPVLAKLEQLGYITRGRSICGNIYKIADLSTAKNWESENLAERKSRQGKARISPRESEKLANLYIIQI